MKKETLSEKIIPFSFKRKGYGITEEDVKAKLKQIDKIDGEINYFLKEKVIQ